MLFSKEWDTLLWGASEHFYLRVSGIPHPTAPICPRPISESAGLSSPCRPRFHLALLSPFLPSFDRLFSIGYPAFLLCLQTLLCYWVFPLCLQKFSSHQALKTKVLLFPQELLSLFCNEPPTLAFSNLTSNPFSAFHNMPSALPLNLNYPGKGHQWMPDWQIQWKQTLQAGGLWVGSLVHE